MLRTIILSVSAWTLCSGFLAAAIVYHEVTGFPPLISYFPETPPQEIDLDGDGIYDVSIVPEPLGSGLSAPRRSAVFAEVYSLSNPIREAKVIPLTLGEEIGPLLASHHRALSGFYSDSEQPGIYELAGMYLLGAPPDQVPIIVGEFVLIRAYAGVRFEIAGETHYGWLDLENAVLGGGAGFKAYGWAYETQPNTPIVAGATPEPTSALLIAVGGGLLLAKRRRASPPW